MKVLFLAAHSEAEPSSRLKVYQFLPLLKEKGIKYRVICFAPLFLYKMRLTFVNNKPILFTYYILIYLFRLLKTIFAIIIAPRFDIVYIQQPIIPFGLERVLKLANKNIIFQFTDAIFLASREGEKSPLEQCRSRLMAKSCIRMASVAKCCLVENDYNKAGVSKFCSYIDKITGPIDADRYHPIKSKKEDKVVIGWTGSAFTTKYLYEIKDALRDLFQRQSLVLRLIGARKDFVIDGVNCEIKDWKPDTELKWLASFDIGIMPLTDDMWTKGKASYKLLQYMSMGIPVVISPGGLVGFDNKIIKDGVNGFLANSKEEWIEKLSLLIKNKELRQKIGQNARITIEEHYSLKKVSEDLIKIFEKTLSLKQP